MDDKIKGRRIGRYELIGEIGRGGMAIVYRAIDTMLDREVAIKVLHPHLSSHPEARERFHREARAVARLRHPNVLEIYDYSDIDGVDVYIVMELVEGSSMRKYLDQHRGEPMSAEAAALVMHPVVIALAHAHANGIIHRDVKPENILIGGEGTIKLSDFGIAHLAGVSQMTATGQILGSPAYMSPDHIELEDLDARADIFSVGTMLYELAVGRPPFEGPNPHAIIKKIVEGTYSDPIRRNPAVGHQLSQIIKRCLATSPEDRHESADQLAGELTSLLNEMEIEPCNAELEDYFADAEIWNSKRRREIISKTLSLGLRARKARQPQAAIDHFNRVLAMEPGNEKAIAAVVGMGRQRRARRIVERALIIVPVVVACAAIIWATVHGSASEPPPPSAAEGAPKQSPPGMPDTAPALSPRTNPDAAKTADAGLIQKITTPRVKKKRKQFTKPPSNRSQKTRVVVFTPQPMAVQIMIDDGPGFPFGPANRKKEIRVGKHKITFLPNDPKRFYPQTWTINIPAGKAPYQLRGRLRWRPAKLIVESNVREASVTIPGRISDRANRIFEIPMGKGPTEQVSALISAKGYIPRTRPIKITAGELARIRVTLVEVD